MKLKLEFQKDATPYIEFLANFKKLSDSILLEFDIASGRFSAKALGGNGEIEAFRHSYLPFEVCDVKVETDIPAAYPNQIVYHGLLNSLGKLIAAVSQANQYALRKQQGSVVIEMNCAEDTAYGLFTDENGSPKTFEVLRSTGLKISAPGCNSTIKHYKLTQFKLLTDSEFNDYIYYLDPSDKLVFQMEDFDIENILKMADVFKTSAKNGKASEFVCFNIANGNIGVSGATLSEQSTEESNTNYVAEGIEMGSYQNQSIRIQKEWFKKIVTKGPKVWVASIGTSSMGEVDRICIESVDENTGIVTKATIARTMDE